MKLRYVLSANVVFSVVSAIVLVAASAPLAEFLGTPVWVPVVVGVALLPWAGFVLVNARREPPSRRDTWITIAGDLAWVIGAAVVIVLPDTLSSGGKWALGFVSLVVLDLAVFQWLALRLGW